MDTTQITELLREGVWVAIKLGGPMLVLSMAVTQIHEQTLSFILKLIVVVLVCLVGGNWMMTTLLDYTRNLFTLMRG